ncbi:phage head spike fiber domain-containing protein [Aeromonas veronii]|uniref:phage head spike fiber domain-containing protein n=1 Tax=Aeromonas veronii TaxID=654 RepID=UPI003D1D7711
MAGLWYRVGTVSVTNGSKKVTGFGTKWKTSVSKPDKGHTVWAPDGKAYELDYVESDTVLWLVSSYSGTTAADQHYAIDISRSGSNSAFSRDLSAFVAYHQLQMDGWQQLLTGTGDVTLTAPDGTKLTVPSWEKIMNAGTGVVALAKAEADRAKSEAGKAAASATAAGDVVAASALPLPDVWAPLSDSLRLITGYGRDVLVGSDIVARMVNFSRNTTKLYTAKDGSLRVAAANEPAFESDGLLHECQSTNLILTHDTPTGLFGFVQEGTIEAPLQGNTAKIYKLQALANPAIRFNAPLSSASPVIRTSSCYVMPIGAELSVSINCEDRDKKVVVCPAGKWTRISTTKTGPSAQFYNFFDVSIAGGVVGQKVAVWGAQLEDMPLATSLILTTGSAATRAQDRAWIASAGNSGRLATMSIVAKPLASSGAPRSAVFGAKHFGCIEVEGGAYRFSGSGVSSTSVPIGEQRVSRVFARRAAGGQVTFGSSTSWASTSVEPGGSDWGDFMHIGAIFTEGAQRLPFIGHLRDFKVWLEPRNLSDAQIKAIA